MKKNIKEITILLFFILILFGMLNNYNTIILSIKNSTQIWLYKLFPSLFPFLLIGTILINLNLAYILQKFFKVSNSFIIMLLSLISGFPSSAKYTKEMYLNKFINLKQADNMLCFSFFANPLFLLSVLSLTFNKSLVIYIILSHYLANFIIYFFLRKKDNIQTAFSKTNESLGTIISKSIKDCINTMLLILGTITFYNIIISLTTIYLNNHFISSILTGILEFSQGLNNLNTLNISAFFKAYLAIIFISFGSLSIHSQIKSIILDTNISYKKFLFYRVIHVIIAIILFNIFYLL